MKKYLHDIASGESKLLEANTDDRAEDIIVISKYKFTIRFLKGRKRYFKKASTEYRAYLIIDEIGQLELERKGLSPVTDEIISKYFIYL